MWLDWTHLDNPRHSSHLNVIILMAPVKPLLPCKVTYSQVLRVGYGHFGSYYSAYHTCKLTVKKLEWLSGTCMWNSHQNWLQGIPWRSSGWDFAFQCRSVGQSLVRGLRSHMPNGQKKKSRTYKRSNFCNKFNKDLKKKWSTLKKKKLDKKTDCRLDHIKSQTFQ